MYAPGPRQTGGTPAGAGHLLSRRTLLQGLGVAAAVPALSAVLSACSTGGGSGGGKLTFVYMGNATQQKATKQAYQAFIKSHPRIDFEPQGIASNNWASFANTLSTRIAGGQTPDVIDIATEGLGIFRSKQLVAPLDPYIAKHRAAIDDYYADLPPRYKAVNDQFGNPGKTTYYMPGGFNTVALYCNEEVFAKAGVDLPGDEDWTWDDFERAAAKIKQKTGAYILNFTSDQFAYIMPWLLTNGASTFNADWTKPTIDSDAAIEAAEYCRMMVAKGYAPKPGGTFDAPTALSQGKLASLAGGRWPNIDMQRLDLVDKVRIVKSPMKTVSASPIGWDAFPILKASQDKDDAWTFIEYLTTKESAITAAKAGGSNVPARKSVALSSAFLDGAPKGTELLYQIAQDATPVPSINRGAESEQAIEAAWLKILLGNGDPAATLKQVNEQLEALL
ncbi:sugar ABC transporter substrate-binding protein [Curtobacterium sp. MCBD17_019]|uniref:ABC transporter substrate-binding protein n=1 Tax=Curtobacterium sp. MCBD17_019 TaxID=2175669 RepID=UPI001C64CB64|nr:sugar ABC transporter substrate-binding protein [Curtobacterium sp. MCBD17_019]